MPENFIKNVHTNFKKVILTHDNFELSNYWYSNQFLKGPATISPVMRFQLLLQKKRVTLKKISWDILKILTWQDLQTVTEKESTHTNS